MNSFVIRHSSFVILTAAFFLLSAPHSRAGEPLRALLITGGCCHDYEAQKKILTEGISARPVSGRCSAEARNFWRLVSTRSRLKKELM
jgi:hypothetical protein